MSRSRLHLAVALAGVAVLPGAARADRARARAMMENGQLLAAGGQQDAALRLYRQSMEEDPDYLPAYDAAMDVWLATGLYQDLIVHMGEVTLRQPTYAPGWYALGFAYRRIARYDLSIMCYEAYLELRPHEPDPYFGLAMAHLELGHRPEAAKALERYLAMEDRPERAGFVAEARAELDRARGTSPAGLVDTFLRGLTPAADLARRAARQLSGVR